MKMCSTCRQIKDNSEFGLESRCKACIKERNKQSKPSIFSTTICERCIYEYTKHDWCSKGHEQYSLSHKIVDCDDFKPKENPPKLYTEMTPEEKMKEVQKIEKPPEPTEDEFLFSADAASAVAKKEVICEKSIDGKHQFQGGHGLYYCRFCDKKWSRQTKEPTEEYANIINIIEEYDNGHSNDFDPEEYKIVEKADLLKDWDFLYNKIYRYLSGMRENDSTKEISSIINMVYFYFESRKKKYLSEEDENEE